MYGSIPVFSDKQIKSLQTPIHPYGFYNTCQILQDIGQPCEEHTVTTSDGYILSLQRIPISKIAPSKVILIAHGLMDTSTSWYAIGLNYYSSSIH